MNKNLEKIVTIIVLFGLVNGIYSFDPDHIWSFQHNGISYIGFIVFIAYLIYSVRKANQIDNP